MQVKLFNSAQSPESPVAQFDYKLQSLVPGNWQNPLPLTGPADNLTAQSDVNRKTYCVTGPLRQIIPESYLRLSPTLHATKHDTHTHKKVLPKKI